MQQPVVPLDLDDGDVSVIADYTFIAPWLLTKEPPWDWDLLDLGVLDE